MAAAIAPAAGQEWADGLNPGCTWKLRKITDDGVAHLRMFRDGEKTRSQLRWPVNRWQALVGKQLLELVERVAA